MTRTTELKPVAGDAQDLRTRAMQVAISQDGVRELTANAGPAVETYLKAVGLGPGNSWCMAFVYWAYQQAAQALRVGNPLVKTGHCLHQYNNVPENFRTKAPKAGDIFILFLNKKTGAGHTGIVTKVNANGTFDSIEGNTNDNGSANGDGVYRRTGRKISSVHGFIRVP